MQTASAGAAADNADGWRRLAALAYDGVLLFGIVFVAGYLFVALARDAQAGPLRLVFQLYLLALCGAYFVFCWVRTGQTLAMKAWGLRLVTADGAALRPGRALLRYLLAIPSIGSGLGLVWALFDPGRQFLHDRLAGTRIVLAQAPGTGQRTAAGASAAPAADTGEADHPAQQRPANR